MTLAYSNGRAPMMAEHAAKRALDRFYESREIGEQLRYQRRLANVSQSELAAYLGVSRQTIGNVEHGRRFLRPRERAAAARALGVSIAALTFNAKAAR